MSNPFTEGSAVSAALLRWWKGLEDDRGAGAELRRCHSLLDVMLTPAFQAVRQRLIEAGLKPRASDEDRLAAIIGLAAHLKEAGDQEPAPAFSEGERPAVSPLRFRQILDARDDEELFHRLRRVLPLVEHLGLSKLARDVFNWDEATRKRWVYGYRWPQKQSA